MGDAIKIAVKAGLIGVITAAIIALFVNIQVPSYNVSLVVNAIGKGRAIVQYYAGSYIVLLDVGLWLFGLKFVAIPILKISLLAVKWVMKVNE